MGKPGKSTVNPGASPEPFPRGMGFFPKTRGCNWAWPLGFWAGLPLDQPLGHVHRLPVFCCEIFTPLANIEVGLDRLKHRLPGVIQASADRHRRRRFGPGANPRWRFLPA